MNTAKSSGLSIPQLRNIIIACLIVGVAGYTAVMFLLSERIASQFGPQVRTDLEWRYSAVPRNWPAVPTWAWFWPTRSL